MEILYVGETEDLTLPFFAYGIFKPGQIAYGQIKRYVEGNPTMEIVDYETQYRDGVPILIGEKSDHLQTRGYLIHFDDPQSAYERIGMSEPEELYEWRVIDVNGKEAYALVGVETHKGCFEDRESFISNYHYRSDPFFNEALELVGECIDNYRYIEKIDMKDFFIIQMHYMLLWSIIERFCTFKYGYRFIGANKFRFAREKIFKRKLKEVVNRYDVAYSSDKLIENELDSNDYESIKYYYAIRCNVVHKGKMVKKEDTEKIKLALNELYQIFKAVYDNDVKRNSAELKRLHDMIG